MANCDLGYFREASATNQRHRPAIVLPLLGSESFQTLLPLCTDIIALFVARSIALLAARQWLGVAARSLDTPLYTLFFTLFVAVVMYLFDGYRTGELRRPEQELERTFKALTAAFASMLSAEVLLIKGVPQSRYGTAMWYLFGLVLVLIGRFSLRGLYARFRKAGYARRRSVLIGSPRGLMDFEQHLAIQQYRGYEILAVIPAVTEAGNRLGEEPGMPGLGEVEHWREIVRRVKAEIVVVNLDEWSAASRLTLDIVRDCEELGVRVELCSALFHTNSLNFEIDNCSGCLRLRTRPKWSTQMQRACKAILDILIGLIGSAVVLMIAPVIWVLLKMEDGGPLFHRREFVDCDGKVRYYLKFRTMIQNADDFLRDNPELRRDFTENHKLRDDPRILRIGRILRKFSIDEFPQFLSVLTGKLTFVGPRVISSAETGRYGSFLAKRLTVKPGLTGYWQVMGRQTTTYEERVLMDLFYIDHWSIWLDLVIIGKTFRKFFAQEGAY